MRQQPCQKYPQLPKQAGPPLSPQVPQLPTTPASKQAVICGFRALNWLSQRCGGKENWGKKAAGVFSWARGGGGANLHRMRVEYRHKSAPNRLCEMAKRCSTGSKRRPAGTIWPRPHQLTLLVILDGVATFRLLVRSGLWPDRAPAPCLGIPGKPRLCPGPLQQH